MQNLKLLAAILLLPLLATAADAPHGPQSFAWLSGHWCSQAGDEFTEEYWMSPAGTVSLGLARTVKQGRTTAFEFLRIESQDGNTRYVAQPQGRPPTAFRLTASGPDWARFENPDHDFPRRVEYRRSGAGLQAEIAGPGEDGREQVIRFSYRRCVD